MNVDVYVTGITYDEQGRLASSDSTTHRHGSEVRVFYQHNGRELSPLELAAFLQAQTNVSVDELLAQGVLTAVYRRVDVNDVNVATTSDLRYDSLNRLIGSKEVTFNADGSRVETTLSNIKYDKTGRMVAMTSSVHTAGTGTALEYILTVKP